MFQNYETCCCCCCCLCPLEFRSTFVFDCTTYTIFFWQTNKTKYIKKNVVYRVIKFEIKTVSFIQWKMYFASQFIKLYSAG